MSTAETDTFHLDDSTLARAVIAILVQRLGGKVKIVRADFAGIALSLLEEGQDVEDGAYLIRVTLREARGAAQ